MDIDPNWVAALSAAGGGIAGVLGSVFARGKADGIASVRLKSIDEKLTILTDELARRITVLEQRYQYDGHYTMPRHLRPTPAE